MKKSIVFLLLLNLFVVYANSSQGYGRFVPHCDADGNCVYIYTTCDPGDYDCHYDGDYGDRYYDGDCDDPKGDCGAEYYKYHNMNYDTSNGDCDDPEGDCEHGTNFYNNIQDVVKNSGLKDPLATVGINSTTKESLPKELENIDKHSSNKQLQVIKNDVESTKFPEVGSAINSVVSESQQDKEVVDPVDVTTGSFNYSNVDLIIPTLGVPLKINRFYHSIDNKWTFDLDFSLELTNKDQNIKLNLPNGNKDILNKVSDDHWKSDFTHNQLFLKNGYYVLIKPNKINYYFDNNGKIQKILDEKGNGIIYKYTNNGIIFKDNLGNLLAIVKKDNNKRIIKITDAKGNYITYNWDGNKLISYTDRVENKFNYKYDKNGFMYKIVGPDGNAYVENIYDEKGRVLVQSDGSGNKTKFKYEFFKNISTSKITTITYPDGTVKTYNNFLTFPSNININGNTLKSYTYYANLPIAKKDAEGNSTIYGYDSNARITKKIDAEGNVYKYTYDDNNNLIKITQPDNTTTQFTYDDNNNLIKITQPDNTTTQFTYNKNNQIIFIKDSLGNITTFDYDQRGFLSSIQYPNGSEVRYKYDENGNLIKFIDSLGRETDYIYDNNSRLIKIHLITGDVTYKYDSYGDLIEITDEKNRNTKMEYNVDGLLTKITLFDGRVFQKKYDVMGRVIEQIDDEGRSIKYNYDGFGRLSTVIDPKGNQFHYIYDKVGNLMKVVDAKGNEQKIDYDKLYRPNKIYDSNGHIVSTTIYNKTSLPTNIKFSDGKSLKFSYDKMGRIVSTNFSNKINSKALYDSLGRKTAIIDPKGYKTSYEYDSMGNLIKEINPLRLSTSYKYDKANRLIQISTPKGITYNFKYNQLDEITNTTISNNNETNEIDSSYDKYGKLLTIKDKEGEISYTYDNYDKIRSRKDIYGNIVKYEYDKDGKISKLIYPNGKYISYQYDKNGNLIRLKDINSNLTNFEYDSNSLLTKITYPTGAYTTYFYDKNNRLIAIKNYDSKGKEIISDYLKRNKVGNIINIQPISYLKPDYNKIPSLNFKYNEFNQLVSSNEGNFTYDKNGNLISFPLLGNNNSYVYDVQDRLIKANILGNKFNYKYDAENNRIEVSKNGNSTRYLIDNVLGLSKAIAKLNNDNSISEYYIYGPSGLLYSTNDNGDIKLYFYDYKGNTKAVIDNNDKVLAAYNYSAYGILLGKYETFENPFKFLGKYGVMTDNDIQIYIRFRYYNPYFARWNKPDVLEGDVTSPLSINKYAYNMGDPVNFVDVNGMMREKFYNHIDNMGIGDTLNNIHRPLDPILTPKAILDDLRDIHKMTNSSKLEVFKNMADEVDNFAEEVLPKHTGKFLSVLDGVDESYYAYQAIKKDKRISNKNSFLKNANYAYEDVVYKNLIPNYFNVPVDFLLDIIYNSSKEKQKQAKKIAHNITKKYILNPIKTVINKTGELIANKLINKRKANLIYVKACSIVGWGNILCPK